MIFVVVEETKYNLCDYRATYHWFLSVKTAFFVCFDYLCQQKPNIVSKLDILGCKYWDLTGFGALKTTNSNKRFHAKIRFLPISFWFSFQFSKWDSFSKKENNSTLCVAREVNLDQVTKCKSIKSWRIKTKPNKIYPIFRWITL